MVGGTGILAPAAAALVASGSAVTVVGRGGRPAPPGSELREADARDASALASALGEREWDRALVYGGAIAEDAVGVVRSRVAGRCVTVRTSAAVDPALGEPRIPSDVLQLGWTADVPARWHTPEEVSAAAIEVLADGEPRILGVIRPWGGRPS